jgi:hypothetical protein
VVKRDPPTAHAFHKKWARIFGLECIEVTMKCLPGENLVGYSAGGQGSQRSIKVDRIDFFDGDRFIHGTVKRLCVRTISA